MTQIALLGAGAMGSRVAKRFLQANYRVVVWNRTPNQVKPLLDQGATYANTPKEAAEQANIVMSMVADDEASQQVWLDVETGAVRGLGKDAIALESSTLTLDWTKELGAEIECWGGKFLEAPVVGSRPQAEAGQLIFLVGGEASTLEKVQDCLLAIGAAIHHVGAVGQGMLMKLAVNDLFGIQVAALSEVMAMLSRHGINSVKAMECLGELPVMSPVAKGAGNLIVNQNHAPLFPIRLVEKDFRYTMQAAKSVKVATPVSTAVHGLYQSAMSQGYGDNNITGIADLWN